MNVNALLYAAGSLLVVLLLVVLAGRAARATGLVKAKPTDRLAILESLTLDRHRRLLLVRCDGHEVLMLTGSSDLVVGWLAAQPQATATGYAQ